ncbi:hypothetical protein BGX24_012808 [Mortierella sp. AD032]|nr:hypothetical protein BGX24_012808 [Mortierella sp. AD032]
METELPQVQAVRPVNKDSLESVVDTTLAPKITHFDCYVDPTTKKRFILWDDIRQVFPDALYVRHQARMVPFMKGIDFMPLQPLRIGAIPDVTTDQDTAKETTVQQKAAVQKDVSANPTTPTTITETNTATIGRNPEYGLVETAMQNYNHIDHYAFGPQTRSPQLIPRSAEEDSNHNKSTDSLASIYGRLAGNKNPLSNNTHSIDNRLPQSPQDLTAAANVKDISSIVVKATLGDSYSQVQLGDMHKIGDNVEQDYEAARYWYLKAANQGNASAQCSVGDLYRLGLGIESNHSTALTWYQKAVDQGDASGQCSLGLMFQYGLAVEMDYTLAMNWYHKSADQGYALAQCHIGDLHYNGRGVPKNYSKAMGWYLLAVKQDLSWAHFNVGLLHLYGLGVAKDKDVALEWLHKATTHRDIDGRAQLFKGFLYLEGLGTTQDYSKAREWFQKAVRQGIPEAQHLIADLYLSGYGVPQDYTEALRWFRKAADQHLPEAQCNIGHMYRLGLGIHLDQSIAKEWYTKAALQEVPAARKALEEMQQSMDKEKCVRIE